jgi:membrane protein YqaA with SNARE-associated domain
MSKEKITIKEKLVLASQSKYGSFILYFISCIESIFFPIPPDFLMIPMVVGKRSSWKKLALGVTVFSIVGAFIGYMIGAIFFDTVGQWIMNTYSLQEEFQTVQNFYQQNAFWSIIVAGFTPIPYKVFTITSGMFDVNLITFFVASVVGRGARFFLVGYLASVGGNQAFWSYLKKLKLSTWIIVGIISLVLVYWFLIK